MMTDLTYRPEQENKVAFVWMTVFFLIACLSVLVGMVEVIPNVLWQSLMLLALALTLLFGIRYMLSYRTYSLHYMKGRHVLVVTDTVGRRITTLCHVYLDEVLELRSVKAGEKPKGVEAVKNKRLQKFVFQNVLRPSLRAYVYADGGDRVNLLCLQTSDVFFSALQQRMQVAKAEAVREAAEDDT